MVFSSHIFLFYFLPLALAVYYALPRRTQLLALAALSYLFYGWSNPVFMALMFASTVIDYACGLVLSGARRHGESCPPAPWIRKSALAASIVANLGLLGFFKYYNFAVENYHALMAAIGLGREWDTFLSITLPLGISFYTFQSMSYSIDVYRGDARAIRRFTDFACYVAMFPQLVAGPIIRFHEVARQLVERVCTMERFARGAAFVSLGLAKKILIANPCGKIADTCFEAGSRLTVDAWYGLFAYSFQIYFDFSAYSDMAIGLGLMLGFVFPKNFDSPYRARSITEFWRRWHLSLSFFLRDYLYIALGGNRKGNLRTYVNLAVVMLLGGLWHGAAWNFVLWGAMHGILLACERTRGKDSLYRRAPVYARVGLTFLLVSLAWVLFRAPDLPGAFRYYADLLGMGETAPGARLLGGFLYQPYYLAVMISAVLLVWAAPQTWDFTRRLDWPRVAWSVGLLAVSAAVMSAQTFNPFIYFIF